MRWNYISDLDAYGEALRQERFAYGLTHAVMAYKTGLSSWTISRLEAGRHEPSPKTLSRLAKVFGPDCTVMVRGTVVNLTPSRYLR